MPSSGLIRTLTRARKCLRTKIDKMLFVMADVPTEQQRHLADLLNPLEVLEKHLRSYRMGGAPQSFVDIVLRKREGVRAEVEKFVKLFEEE